MDRINHADVKRQYLHVFFDKHYKAWAGQELKDDRQLFCNRYEMLLEAIEVMEGIDNNFVWVGFNVQFNKYCVNLAEIQQRFPL